MADKVTFELVSPERLLLSVEADMVVVPGSEGDFGVLAGHQPVISTLRPGSIDVYEGDRIAERIFVAGGFAEVSADRLTVLAEEATPFNEVDRPGLAARIEAARRAVEAAEEDKRDVLEEYLAYLVHMGEVTHIE
ncbi:MAG TPA: F0F1 ATP synthase subunit epsilon [Candidatus Cybelea sp.]|nr:F0F1 ATP synthase subunit epsilon [Candidatus Cybelea sp.]